MNNYLRKLLQLSLGTVILLNSIISYGGESNATSVCTSKPSTVIFFNGVLKTRNETKELLKTIKAEYGDIDKNGTALRYEFLYSNSKGLLDFVTVFEQRLKANNGFLSQRFELFFESIHGGGSWWSIITTAASASTQILDAIVDSAKTAAVQNIKTLLDAPPTESTYQEHRAQLDGYIATGSNLLFIAHSQGNLYANPAYDYVRLKLPANNVKIVHIAPASATVRGPWVLADLDLVIAGLRLFGATQENNAVIPRYSQREAGLNSEKDILGHGLLEIYLNKSLETSKKVNGLVNQALNELSVSACPKYILQISAEQLSGAANQCGPHSIGNDFPKSGSAVSGWTTNSCYKQLVIRPQNLVSKTIGFDPLNPPIIDKQLTGCTFANPNIRYSALNSPGISSMRFASEAFVRSDDLFPYAKNNLWNDPIIAWGFRFESYIDGDLPYGRPPGDLKANCQITYKENAASPTVVISSTITVPNVLTTFDFATFRNEQYGSSVAGVWPHVSIPNCGPNDCLGLPL